MIKDNTINKKFDENPNKSYSNNNSYVKNDNTLYVNGLSISIGDADKQIYLMQEENKDLQKFPLGKLGLMFLSYKFMLFINFLKGSDHFNSIINVKM